MTTPFAFSIAAWSRFSPRERLLVGVAGAITALLVAIYLGLTPGLEAAHSAEDRRRLAASDLQEVKRLSAEVDQRRAQAALAPQGDVSAVLGAVAAEHGVRLLDAQETNGVRIVRLTAPSSDSVASFSAAAADALGAATSAMSIARGDGAVLSATLTFGGGGS